MLAILGYTSSIGEIEKLPAKINISSPTFRQTQIQVKDVFGTYTETCIWVRFENTPGMRNC